MTNLYGSFFPGLEDMKKTRTSHKGRVCKFPRCKNLLSIYNHEIYCHIHLRRIGGVGKTRGAE